MASPPLAASVVQTLAIVVAAVAALVLPVYQLTRDGVLPRPFRRGR